MCRSKTQEPGCLRNHVKTVILQTILRDISHPHCAQLLFQVDIFNTFARVWCIWRAWLQLEYKVAMDEGRVIYQQVAK